MKMTNFMGIGKFLCNSCVLFEKQNKIKINHCTYPIGIELNIENQDLNVQTYEQESTTQLFCFLGLAKV